MKGNSQNSFYRPFKSCRECEVQKVNMKTFDYAQRLLGESVRVIKSLHVFFLDLALLRDLPDRLSKRLYEVLQLRRLLGLCLQEPVQVLRESAVFVDPFNMAVNEINHIVEGFLDIFLFSDLIAGLENSLDRLGTTTSARATHAISSAAMVRSKLASFHVENLLGLRSTYRCPELSPCG